MKIINNSFSKLLERQRHIFNYELCIMNYELFSGRSGYRRRAFRSIFARYLAKDAAPIPNAPSYYKNSESQNLRASKFWVSEFLKL